MGPFSLFESPGSGMVPFWEFGAGRADTRLTEQTGDEGGGRGDPELAAPEPDARRRVQLAARGSFRAARS